jgi:hypothetical protein
MVCVITNLRMYRTQIPKMSGKRGTYRRASSVDKETPSTYLRVLSYPPPEGSMAYLKWMEELQSTCMHAYSGSIRVAHLESSRCRLGHPIVQATFRCGYVHEFSELEMRICINFHNKVCATGIQSFKIQRKAAMDEKHVTINDEVHETTQNASGGSLSNDFPRDEAAELPALTVAAILPAINASAASVSTEQPRDDAARVPATTEQLPANNASVGSLPKELPHDDAAKLPASTVAAQVPTSNASAGSLPNALPRDDAAHLPANNASAGSLHNELPHDEAAKLPASTDPAQVPASNASAGSLRNSRPRDDAAHFLATSDAAPLPPEIASSVSLSKPQPGDEAGDAIGQTGMGSKDLSTKRREEKRRE